MATVLVAVTLVAFTGISGASAYSYTINRTSSGLVMSDPLDGSYSQSQLGSQSQWTFGGDAPGLNASYAYYEDSSGLHIGVTAPANGTYAGYYAEVQRQVMLAQAVITAPSTTIPYGYFNAGLYVQTGSPTVSYIYCGPQTSSAGTFWGVASTTGNANGATSYQSLYYDSSSNQPLTGSCTIVTNGQNYLAVYIDNQLVYSSSTLSLGYSEPFYIFLESESSYNGAMLYGTFQDFYATTSGNVTVTGNPSNAATVKLLDSSGTTLASSPVSSGTASLDIAANNFPVSGTIDVYDSTGATIASAPVTAYGGDVYQVSASSTTSSSSSISSASSSSTSTSASSSSMTSTSSSTTTSSSTSSSTTTSSSTSSSSTTTTTTSTSTSSTSSPHPTQTTVSCHDVGLSLTCTASVTDLSGNPTPPTGTVLFTSTPGGSIGSCTLSGGSSTTTCSVSFTVVVVGSFTVTASYGGDGSHLPSSGSQKISCILACL